MLLTFILGACSSNEQKVESQENTSAAETRIVEDEFGKVEIPAHPQRVAAVYLEDYLSALDIKPVIQWYHPIWGIQEYLNLDVPKFDVTGSIELYWKQSQI